jgi:hypothetical protein
MIFTLDKSFQVKELFLILVKIYHLGESISLCARTLLILISRIRNRVILSGTNNEVLFFEHLSGLFGFLPGRLGLI